MVRNLGLKAKGEGPKAKGKAEAIIKNTSLKDLNTIIEGIFFQVEGLMATKFCCRQNWALLAKPDGGPVPVANELAHF